MKMKCICRDNFEINDVLIGAKGDELEVIDAIAEDGENPEDVMSYCDIKNLTTNKIFWATWSEVDDNEVLTNILWLDEFVDLNN